MWYLKYNTSYLKPTRKSLRTNQTKPEEILWNKLRNKQFYWIKFRRQHSIWRYILDFYSSEIKLCIEIDWDSHFDEKWKNYDEIRTDFLESIWIKVIRFTNNEIIENIDWVMNNLETIINIKYVK